MRRPSRRCWSGPTCAASTATACCGCRAMSGASAAASSTRGRISRSSPTSPPRPSSTPTAAFGPVGMSRGMDIAIDKARKAGIGVCVVRRVTHMAAIGWFPLRAARQDMIGLVFRLVQAEHGLARRAGARRRHQPDRHRRSGYGAGNRSCSTCPHRRARWARSCWRATAGRRWNRAWRLPRTENPPPMPLRRDFLTPLGGAKGAGLSLMFECLTGVLVGNPLIAAALGPEGRLAPRPERVRARHRHRRLHRAGALPPGHRHACRSAQVVARGQGKPTRSGCPANAATGSWRNGWRAASRCPRAHGAASPRRPKDSASRCRRSSRAEAHSSSSRSLR